MKIFKKLIAVVAAMIFLSNTAIAQRHESPKSWLKYLSGDWYDNNGKLVLSIHDGYINGCKILYCQRVAGGGGMAGGDFCISESAGNRLIHLSWNIQHQQSESLAVDRRQTLHKFFPFHFESVGGIHLGMTRDEVNKKLGNDIKKISKSEVTRLTGNTFGFDDISFVEKLGVILTFEAGSVDRIILLKSSKAVFDRSRLNCSNSLKDFAAAYQIPLPRYPKHFGIGHGEHISFGEGMRYIMLSNYNN